MHPRSGARILVDQLRIHGASLVFGVPGESYLAVLDALHDVADDLRYIVCRQEAGAGNMAEAYGKMTGEPGICMVTRGPGASHAAISIHTAAQDSTPMILFVGQIPRHFAGREAFQEVDYHRMFGDQAKLVLEITDPARIPEHLARAFTTATSGRPGPVVVALPEDMLMEEASVADANPYQVMRQHPDPEAMAEVAQRLRHAKQPLLIAGGGGWTGKCGPLLQKFAQRTGVPLAAAFRRRDCIDNSDEHYVGDVGLGINPDLDSYFRDADLLIAVGPRLGEITTGGYERLTPPCPQQDLIHIQASADELGRVFQPRLGIQATMEAACSALAEIPPLGDGPWAEKTRRLRQSFLRHIDPVTSPGDVNVSEIVAYLRNRLAPDAIHVNGAGNYAAWANRFSFFRGYGTQLAPTSGAMGYSVPAAVAASLVHPDREVISYNGDGCFMMTCQEIATAAQYGVAPIFIVINNAMYGTIRMHQERHFPGRESSTSLMNPDFAALAEACGGYGEVVERTEQFKGAFERARHARKFALIELKVDQEAITPTATLSEIRKKAIASQKSYAIGGPDS